MKKSLLDKLRRSFVKTVPYSVTTTLVLFSAAMYYSYNNAVRAADLNQDGVTSEQELKEVFQGIGEQYNSFMDIAVNSKRIKDYCSRK
jgi:hypothetical protein